MLRKLRNIIFINITILIFIFITNLLYSLTGDEIVKKADSLMNSDKYTCDSEMEIHKSNSAVKKYKMNVYFKRDKKEEKDQIAVFFTYPEREKNRAYLKNGDDIWIFMPSNRKFLRVSGKNDMMGSDFSNNDVLSVDISKDYSTKLLSEEKKNDFECYKLECKAKKKSTTYDKIIYWVRKKDFVPVQRDFYTVSGKHLKTLIFDKVDKKNRPTKFIMYSVLDKDNKSIIYISNYVENPKFSDNVFTKSYIERRK